MLDNQEMAITYEDRAIIIYVWKLNPPHKQTHVRIFTHLYKNAHKHWQR